MSGYNRAAAIEGLDLRNAEDRAILRTRLEEQLRYVKLDAICGFANARPISSRFHAIRYLAQFIIFQETSK